MRERLMRRLLRAAGLLQEEQEDWREFEDEGDAGTEAPDVDVGEAFVTE